MLMENAYTTTIAGALEYCWKKGGTVIKGVKIQQYCPVGLEKVQANYKHQYNSLIHKNGETSFVMKSHPPCSEFKVPKNTSSCFWILSP
jgi:hypothetical protein